MAATTRSKAPRPALGLPLAVETLPRGDASHVWADYIEVLCLADADHYFTQADLLGRLKSRRELGEGIPQSAIQDADDRADGWLSEGESALPDERDESLVKGLFDHLQYRAAEFRRAYPFELNDRRDALHLRKRLTQRHKLYIFFLLSACHERLLRNGPSLLKQFEVVSRKALLRMLPRLRVKLFGSGTTRNDYSGNKWTRICALAKDLCVNVKAKEDSFSKYDVGDAGLDLVAYFPFEDGASHVLVIFAQCACTPAWKTKQFSSGSSRWSNILDFHVPPQNMLFIPYCLRESSGQWHEQHEISQTVMIDRVRLVRLLGEEAGGALAGQPDRIVAETLSTHEQVF